MLRIQQTVLMQMPVMRTLYYQNAPKFEKET